MELQNSDIAHRRKRNRPQQTSGYFEVTEAAAAGILEPLMRYGRLPTSYLVAFYGGEWAKKRLERFYHEAEKLPIAQKVLLRPDELNRNINNQIIHELGRGAFAYLHRYGLLTAETSGWVNTTKIGASERSTHDLLVCLCMASIELAIRRTPNVRFVNHLEILNYARCSQDARSADRPLAFPVPEIGHTFSSGKHISIRNIRVEPDAVFGIEYVLADGGKDWRFFALEVDRGTETVEPSNDLHKSSWLRKVLAYDAIADAHIYRSHLGLKNLLVLSVIPDRRRMQHIMQLVTRHQTMYLFQSMAPLGPFQNPPPPMLRLFTEPWQRVVGSFDLSTIERR
jgi:Replication-relaxation